VRRSRAVEAKSAKDTMIRVREDINRLPIKANLRV
jgi:hypothetical protein